MVAASRIIAASGLLALSYAAPLTRWTKLSARQEGYKVFGGDGTVGQGWPADSEWKSFDELWAINEPIMGISCTQFNQKNNSPDETAAVKSAIEAASSKTGISKEYILSMMMQESKGCVRAPTTNYGVRNPGLMQSHNGQGTCNEGQVLDPCPNDMITRMIEDGVGLSTDFGLIHVLEQSGASDVSKYYKGARIYNSGSIDPSGNLGAGIATHCYASDIANRVRGWDGNGSTCDENTIGGIGGTPGGGNGGNPGQPTDPGNGGGNSPSGPPAPGADPNCKKWYTVQKGDTCASVAAAGGISFEKLRELNASLDNNCTNLWLGSAYCVGN